MTGGGLIPPSLLIFRQKSTVTAKMEHMGSFRPSPLVDTNAYETSLVRFAGEKTKIQYEDE